MATRPSRPRAWRRNAVVAACLLLASACTGRDVTRPHGGEVTLLVRANTANTGIAMVVVMVTAADIQTPLVFNIPVANGAAAGTITLPAGSNRTITMRAYDANGIETHHGSTVVTIQPGTNPTIPIVLIPNAGDVPITVVLGSFVITVAPSADTLAVAATATLTASIVDANGAPVLQPVTWGALNPGIATVASRGDRTAQVTAIAAGSTTVVASYGGTAGSATVIVSAAPKLVVVATGLDLPTYVAQPPGDTSRLFITQQPGWIRVVKNGVLLPTPFLDLRGQVSSPGEQGLLSIAFHPNYANNGWFFIDYTDLTGTIHVTRYTVSSNPDVADPTSAQPVLAVAHPTYANHNGGLVLFGPDGYLYIGLGDGGGGGDPQGNAKDSTKLLGKLLRIDVNGGLPYTVPANNPFVGRAPAAPEVWSYGLRNPWRFSFDRVTHELYIADVGQGDREEVDVQPANSTGSRNYGWNIMEGTMCYPPGTATCNSTGLIMPVYEYAHTGVAPTGCSITGGHVYRGTKLPLLVGRYFFAEYCQGWIRSFRYVNGVVQDLHDYTPELGTVTFPSSWGEDNQGELYVVSRSPGAVYKLVPGP